jgi:putative inorganic carbon (hco3(-)) transporter
MSEIATRSTSLRDGAPSRGGHRDLAFLLFCVFLLSILLRLTVRLPGLGALRFDALLAVGVMAAIFFSPSEPRQDFAARSTKKHPLTILAIYILVTLPFVQWPGSVLNTGLETFFKAVCFFFFVTATVTTPRKLKIVLALYTAAQVFRVLEPLYMHVTTGYWGSFTAMGAGGWEYMDRLSGSPYDIINPNGLGFVVVTTLPLLHFLCAPTNGIRKIVWAMLAGALIYALVLSASRSSFLALIVLVLVVIYRSKRRLPLIVLAVVGSVIALGSMDDVQRDRYLSIVSQDTKNAGTAEGRLKGVLGDFEVALNRPLFGHGVGTSREANANFRGEDKLSHNLYTEVAQELGFVGLAIFLAVIAAFVRDCRAASQIASGNTAVHPDVAFLTLTSASLLVLIVVYLFFSLASYGFSEPYWYFIGGLAAATLRLMQASAMNRQVQVAEPASSFRRGPHTTGAPGFVSSVRIEATRGPRTRRD